MKQLTLSVIITHFRDFQWTSFCYEKIRRNTFGLKLEFIVVNQDRTEKSKSRLEKRLPGVRVICFEKSEAHFKVTGHDHAHVLNQALGHATGDLILIVDSDCHPLDATWLPKCLFYMSDYDAILATDERNSAWSHPCFMLLKSTHLNLDIKFDLDLFDKEIDTGRLIGQQLKAYGQKVLMLSPKQAFDGMIGHFYMDCIYHHTHGSFWGGGTRLQRQTGFHNAYYKAIVVYAGKYELSWFYKRLYCIISRYKPGSLARLLPRRWHSPE